jgi:hypothetical protein
MKIEDKIYSIELIKDTSTVLFIGNLRLHSVNEYNEIMENIYSFSKGDSKPITLDLSKLEFINSSGIASLGILFIKLRDLDRRIKIIASKYVNWHVASLRDFQILNPNIEIDFIVQH